MPLAWQPLLQRVSSVAQAAQPKLLLRLVLALLLHSPALMLRRVWGMLLLRTRLLLSDRAQQWHRDPQVSLLIDWRQESAHQAAAYSCKSTHTRQESAHQAGDSTDKLKHAHLVRRTAPRQTGGRQHCWQQWLM